jgi:hypothetical protein
VSAASWSRSPSLTKDERYNRSEKGRARYMRYRATEKGRANERRAHLQCTTARRTGRINEIKEALA